MSLALSLGLGLVGCGPQPDRIDYIDSMTVYDRNLIVPDARVYDDAGERMPQAPVSIAHISRAEVVSMTTQGFACVGSGQAQVTLSSGALRHDVLVTCMLVGSIQVEPQRLRTVLLHDSSGALIPQELPLPKAQVLSPEGEPMQGLELQMLSDHPERVEIGADSLIVSGQGRTTLSYKAGGRQSDVVVDVGRLVDGRMQIRVPPGGKQIIPLQPGLHHAELRSGYRLKAWMVGPSCGEPMTGSVIRGLECDIGDRGALVVENPSRGTARVSVRLVIYPE